MRASILLAAILPSLRRGARRLRPKPGRACRGFRHDIRPGGVRLIRAGWRPVENAFDPTNPDLASGNGPAFIASGYRELVSCSGTGLAFCRFAFRRAGWLLNVVTAGEEPGARVHNTHVERGDRD